MVLTCMMAKRNLHITSHLHVAEMSIEAALQQSGIHAPTVAQEELVLVKHVLPPGAISSSGTDGDG